MAEMRRCIGSAKFGIAAHDAPIGDFPVQPSQKDGLGRMCKPHWTEYTRALRKAALARKAADADPVVVRARAGIAEREAELASAKPAIRPVPKPAKKPTRRERARADKVHAEGDRITEAADGATDDAAFVREREAELGRAALGPSEETTIA